MLRLAGSVLTALVAGLATADSATLPPGCFARTYEASHLASHPDQRVRRMVLRIDAAEADGRVPMGLRIWTRGRKPLWHAGGHCETEDASREGASGQGASGQGASWTCRPDTDGAPLLRFLPQGAGMRLENPRHLSIFDMTTGPELHRTDIRAPGDGIFLLGKAPTRMCATD